ncbi:MAG: tRNA uridine-5-carboxymethylaminomethyl(34) synthesis enzyme MnmG [Phycisphaerae bacterium]|nr:tRNA uridine-5-carboxymethylaminomethyl(34) synthesis enzyme MnmG [Phycisphaerae bacterium]
MTEQGFDCIVIGGGHAGAEAAHSAARLGADTLLITMSVETIGKLSCNPAIGGLAKGQIVREIDALGGIMGEAIDETGIQFRHLNSSKGAAVQSPRAQADKYKYKDYIRKRLEETERLTIVEGEAAEILTEDSKVTGVRLTDGTEYACKTVIVTAGTFLRGLMHTGDKQWQGGRIGEPASNALSESLKKLGIELGRLKTGTPARLDGTTVDYEALEEQPGDEIPKPFSFLNDSIDRPQVPCWITYTNKAIHDLLKANLDRAPMYSGQIQSTGPRYCPSIETKIMRFADKERHMVHLEPEDSAGTTIYCNGISTSVPEDVQDDMIRLLPGTENAKITTYAYAIEYDYAPARQLRQNLETRKVEGLFLAGQINGTSGYEEAAGQGLVAGVNAARKIAGMDAFVLDRDEAYIGVLIDDLLTKEINEPYRMFTSRAEYRLTLRSDNADRRLTSIGRQIGLVDDTRWRRFMEKVDGIAELEKYLKATRNKGLTLWQQLKQTENPLAGTLCQVDEVKAMNLRGDVIEAAVIDATYEGYLKRQFKQIESFKNLEKIKLPDEIDYNSVKHLSNEARGKLIQFRPATLGQASRIGGITPADISVLQVELARHKA